MLRQYVYVNHKIQEIEKFIAFIFQDVMFQAPNHQNDDILDIAKGQYLPILKKVIHLKIGKQLTEMFSLFKCLTKEQVSILQTAFMNNNQIAALCSNLVTPFRYGDLQNAFEDVNWQNLLEQIKHFCNNFYERYLDLKVFQNNFGNLEAYYKKIVQNDSVCHCCGIDTILTKDNSKRDAFDHYLPKGLYPFISLNFRNLVPTCYHCNSSYKLKTDTLFVDEDGKEKRVKAFLPFKQTSTQSAIHVNIQIDHYDKDNMDNNDFKLTFICEGMEEELENWKRVYHIEERYVSFCRSMDKNMLIMDMIQQNCILDSYAKNEIEKMERMPYVQGYVLLAPLARSICKCFGIQL